MCFDRLRSILSVEMDRGCTDKLGSRPESEFSDGEGSFLRSEFRRQTIQRESSNELATSWERSSSELDDHV